MRLTLLTVLLLCGMIVSATAQDEPDACALPVIDAIDLLANRCAGLTIGTICYGTGNLTYTLFTTDQVQIPSEDASVLQEPGDRYQIILPESGEYFESVETDSFVPPVISPELTPEPDPEATPEATPEADTVNVNLSLIVVDELDEETQNLLAMGIIPDRTGLKGIRLLLFDNGRIENGVFIEDKFLPGNPVEVSVVDASIYTSPFVDQLKIIREVSGRFEADAISVIGNWIRVAYTYDSRFGERRFAWLRIDDVEGEVDFSSLPRVDANSQLTMQTLYLYNDLPQKEACDGVPDPGMLVQTEAGLETDLIVNGVPIIFTGTTYIQQVTEDLMIVTVLSGLTAVFPDSPREVVLAPGFQTQTRIQCFEWGDFGVDQQANDLRVAQDCTFEDPVVLETSQLETFAALTILPDNIITPLPTIDVLRASGEGSAVLEITLGADDDQNDIINRCSTGALPDYICNVAGQ